ncbi:unnamed protein product, partial [Rotaria sordida]
LESHLTEDGQLKIEVPFIEQKEAQKSVESKEESKPVESKEGSKPVENEKKEGDK